MKIKYLLPLLFFGFFAKAQNMQIVYDLDAQGRKLVKTFPFELYSGNDTTVMLEARYGLENNMERFRFVFTVKAKGKMFFRSNEHTTVEFLGEQGAGIVNIAQPGTEYAADEFGYQFVFTAGDLGYEDNDISLNRMGGIHTLVIHQLPDMDMTFKLPKEQYGFLKDLQYSLRLAYSKEETGFESNSNVRGSTGRVKSSRSTSGR